MAKKIKFYKVTELPATLEADAVYFVKTTSTATVATLILTDGDANVIEVIGPNKAIVVASSAARLALKDLGYGTLVYQQDTGFSYTVSNPADLTIEASWTSLPKIWEGSISFPGETPVTSGLLVAGGMYFIDTVNPGDDFSNVGYSGQNYFIAIGTTPTNWTNGTPVKRYLPLVTVHNNTLGADLAIYVESEEIWLIDSNGVLIPGQTRVFAQPDYAGEMAYCVAGLYPYNLDQAIFIAGFTTAFNPVQVYHHDTISLVIKVYP